MKHANVFFECHFKTPSFPRLLMFIICAVNFYQLAAQNTLPLSDLYFFQTKTPTWKLEGDVRGSITQKGVLTAIPGTGVLINLTDFSFYVFKVSTIFNKRDLYLY